MNVDISTTETINRARADVASFAMNPDRAPQWYVNIKSVEWRSPPPLQIGSKIDFVALFLGRRLAYTYEIVELVADEKMTMRTAAGPFPMETGYVFEAISEKQTRMTIRNRGRPSGFSVLMVPFMRWAIARANRKDLAQLKGILESDLALAD